ncbi:hypothetical protein ACT009_14825 [Sphingomonas sp. Tas61C01]|uniref:hypothetical protein n=1 Tax=Sphingomonas sp. Tas61C01 TaxID=3458297 RepID=UPI00403E8C83
MNVQTWTRTKRLDLQNLASAVGNAAMSEFELWPRVAINEVSAGRAVKACAERIAKKLERTHASSDIGWQFSVFESASEELREINENHFFQEVLASKVVRKRSGDSEPLGGQVRNEIVSISAFMASNQPEPPAPLRVARPPSIPTAAERLRALTPDQQIGPVQFEYDGSVIRVRHYGSAIPEIDRASAEQARIALLDEGDWLVGNLQGSNTDRRLTSTIEGMQSRLRERQDVIQLGIANLACDQVTKRLGEELADVMGARLHAYTIGISFYVAQFPEWQRFSENAAAAEHTPADAQLAYQAATRLVAKLDELPELVDPEVPMSIRLVVEALGHPSRATRRAVYALLRILENFAAKALSEFSGMYGAISSGARKGVEAGLKGTAAIAVVFAATQLASSISPPAARVLKATWLAKAAQIAEDLIKGS